MRFTLTMVPCCFVVMATNLFCFTPQIEGAQISVGALRTGWYDDRDGPNPIRSDNFFTGDLGVEHRSFFAFDLGFVEGLIPAGEAIVSASFVVDTHGFQSKDPTETLGLFDVGTPLDRIDSGDGFLDTFEDLGSGKSYGEFVYSAADLNVIRTLQLDMAAIGDINTVIKASGETVFIMGGALLTLDHTPAGSSADVEYIFGLSGGPGTNILVLQTGVVPEPTTVLFDIKPGGNTNSVNLGSKGVLPVAILSADDFDVSDIDVDTLLFGDPLLLDNGGTAVSPLRYAFEDVSDDGLLDLTLKFSVPELVDYLALGSDSIEGLLTGELLDGTSITGTDAVRIVPPRGNGRGNDMSGITASAIPEPSTAVLAVLGTLTVVASARRRMR